MKLSHWWGAAVLVAGLAWSLGAVADGRIFTRDGLAIGGTDPVAYFTEGQPVAGSPDYQLEWHETIELLLHSDGPLPQMHRYLVCTMVRFR